jgi:heme-degrading monooxygenase HmoA
MIARIWHGVTDASRSEDYLDYLNKTGVPDYRATDGNQGVYVLRQVKEGEAHFLLISFWNPLM